MDEQLRVTADGLRVLAGHCEAMTSRLAIDTVPKGAATSDQASVKAVTTCDERIAAAGAALAAWASAMANTLSDSASAYEGPDMASATELGVSVV